MTSTLGAPSTVRLRPAPACDPPYDDERHPDVWNAPVQPPLELELTPPALPEPRHRRAGSKRPGTGTAPGTKAVADRFLKACLEIVNGLRPVAHIRELSRPLEAADVLAAMTDGTRRLHRLTRLPGAGAGRRPNAGTRDARVTLRRMRTCEPRPGALEIAAVIGTNSHTWAAAFRLERRHGRWQCTAAAILA
jgi:hypothetical protein